MSVRFVHLICYLSQYKSIQFADLLLYTQYIPLRKGRLFYSPLHSLYQYICRISLLLYSIYKYLLHCKQRQSFTSPFNSIIAIFLWVLQLDSHILYILSNKRGISRHFLKVTFFCSIQSSLSLSLSLSLSRSLALSPGVRSRKI